jgi:hypothetical protein
VSGLLYQNVGPTILSLLETPGVSQLTGDQRRAFETLTQNSRATLVSVYGEDDGIRVAGTGGAMNLDSADLALPLLLERVMERAMGELPRLANQ